MIRIQKQRLMWATAARVLTLMAACLAGPAAGEGETWSVIRIAGEPVGYFRESVAFDSAGRSVTSQEGVIVINRMGSRVEIIQKAEIEESAAGEALRIRGEMTSSRQSMRFEARVGRGSLEIETSAGGKSYTRSLAFTGTLLGPEGARRLTQVEMKKPGGEISYRMFVPELSTVAGINRRVQARETLAMPGRTIDVVKAEERIEGYPAVRTLWLDPDGRVVKQIEEGPFGLMEAIRGDRQTALSAAAGGSLPEEMYARSLVRANIRLPHPRSIDWIRLRITHLKPELGWPDLGGENQTVLEQDRRHTLLEVRRPVPSPGISLQEPSLNVAKEYLTPNAVLQSDDPEVQRLAREVAGGERDLMRAAGRLQVWTSQNLKLDLGIALASASEVVRDRAGTCVAYSVLLAALERAAGIPARVVMGYAYVNGVWGGHAWTEILAGDQWIPVDATLYAPGVADAARFKFFTSSLEGGWGSGMADLQRLLGHAEVTILEYSEAGRPVTVPVDAAPYRIDGEVYRNDWLRFSMARPENYRFVALEEVWPERTVMGMDGPRGEKVRLAQRSPGAGADASDPASYLRDLGFEGMPESRTIHDRPAALQDAGNRAALALMDGSTVWILKVDGAGARSLLERVAGTWTIW